MSLQSYHLAVEFWADVPFLGIRGHRLLQMPLRPQHIVQLGGDMVFSLGHYPYAHIFTTGSLSALTPRALMVQKVK